MYFGGGGLAFGVGGCCCWLLLLSERAEAKVVGRSEEEEETGFWGGFAASVEVLGREGPNGFGCGGVGFETSFEEVEKGFAAAEAIIDVAVLLLNRSAPISRLCSGVVSLFFVFPSTFPCSSFCWWSVGFPRSTIFLSTLVPLKARILPSL